MEEAEDTDRRHFTLARVNTSLALAHTLASTNISRGQLITGFLAFPRRPEPQSICSSGLKLLLRAHAHAHQ